MNEIKQPTAWTAENAERDIQNGIKPFWSVIFVILILVAVGVILRLVA